MKYMYYCFNIQSDINIVNLAKHESILPCTELIDVKVYENKGIKFDKSLFSLFRNQYADFWFNENETIIEEPTGRIFRIFSQGVEYSNNLNHEIPDVCFIILARLCGKLIIHGAAIELHNKAYLFVGDSGVGKSTLISTILVNNKDAVLITDDIICVDADENKIYYGNRVVSLNPDSFQEFFGKETTDLDETQKIQYELDNCNENSACSIEIEGFYFLEKQDYFARLIMNKIDFSMKLVSNMKLQKMLNSKMFALEMKKINSIIRVAVAYRLCICHNYEEEKKYLASFLGDK